MLAWILAWWKSETSTMVGAAVGSVTMLASAPGVHLLQDAHVPAFAIDVVLFVAALHITPKISGAAAVVPAKPAAEVATVATPADTVPARPEKEEPVMANYAEQLLASVLPIGATELEAYKPAAEAYIAKEVPTVEAVVDKWLTSTLAAKGIEGALIGALKPIAINGANRLIAQAGAEAPVLIDLTAAWMQNEAKTLAAAK